MQAVIWSLPHFADITIWQLVHGILLYVTDNFLGIFSTAIPKLTHITPTHSPKPTSGWVWIPNHLAYPYVWLDLMNYKHRCISHAPFIFREKRTIQHSVISFCLEGASTEARAADLWTFRYCRKHIIYMLTVKSNDRCTCLEWLLWFNSRELWETWSNITTGLIDSCKV